MMRITINLITIWLFKQKALAAKIKMRACIYLLALHAYITHFGLL